MTVSTLADLTIMTVSSAFGTGSTIPLGSAAAISGVTFLSFSGAGTAGGTTVSYSILDPVNGGSEIGQAVYTSSNTTLTSRTPTKSTNGNAAITGSSGALIYGTDRAEDIVTAVNAGTGLSGSFSGGSGTLALALTNATLQASPGSPTGTTSTVGVMMGMGTTAKMTPVYSTRMQVTFFGILNATGGVLAGVTFRYGTGTAPTNGAALTGTTVGTEISTAGAGTTTVSVPFSITVVITGLTVGVAVWFDLSLRTSNAGTSQTISAVTASGFEF